MGDSPMPGKERYLSPRRPSPRWREGWGSVIQRGFARRRYRESPGPGGPRKADPVGASLPAASPPGSTSLGAPNSTQVNESGSVNPLLDSHLPAGSSRASTKLRAPTRPPFIHLSPLRCEAGQLTNHGGAWAQEGGLLGQQISQ